MDSTTQTLDSFFVNGFYHGHIDFIEDIDFNKYTFIDCNEEARLLDKQLEPVILQVKQHLISNFVSKIFDKYTVVDEYAWSGVDSYSKNWHNDLAEGFDSNILVYLDDSHEVNTIEVKSPSEQFKIYPKKGDFVWINQSEHFLHKATHINGTRRVLSFEFKWT
jgi:hypothetical protein